MGAPETAIWGLIHGVDVLPRTFSQLGLQIAVTWDFLGLFLSLHVGQASLVKNPTAVQEIWVWFLFGKIPWRREWLLTPVFLPGKPHGQRSQTGSVHGVAESDTTKHTHVHIGWPNLVMYVLYFSLLFLFLFSFNDCMLKLSQLILNYILKLFIVCNKWLLLTSPPNLKQK